MSFNLNQIVQPECGSPNPLVAAAQQITMQPSSAMTAMSMNYRHIQQQQMNFVQEFQQQQQPSTSRSMPRAMLQSVRGQYNNMLMAQQQQQQQMLNNSIYMQNQFAQQQLIRQQLSGQASPSAIQQQEANQNNKAVGQQQAKDRGDDVEFWQGLAQTYVGPSTYDNIAKMRASGGAQRETSKGDEVKSDEEIKAEKAEQEARLEDMAKLAEKLRLDDLDYIIDERNPLKDVFEDPFAEGLKRLEQGDIPSAALLFEAAIQLKPEDSVAWRYLGTTQAQNEKDTSAIRALTNCLNIDKNDQEARLAIAASLANETRHKEACKHLLEWLINHETYKNTVGASLVEYEQLDSELSDDPFYINSLAEKHYNYVREKFVDAARMSPNNPDPDVQNSLGVLFNIRGEYQKAVDCFKSALSVRSNDSLLWNRLGATLANSLQAEEAVIAYRRALEISPGFLRSRYNLAISLIHLNSYEEAARQLVQILNMQAAGKGTKNSQIRTRSITSTSIWNTLRTVATLMNKPELYPLIDGHDLAQCNATLLGSSESASATAPIPPFTPATGEVAN